MNQRYLVSVVIAGKCVHSYFSSNLDDLVTIKALYKGCVLGIFDMSTLTALTPAEIAEELTKSRLRWKKSLQPELEPEPEPVIEEEKKPEPQKHPKCWKRRVICEETGQIFDSVRECSEHIGLPYMTIVNCIKNKNATRGLHFTAVENKEENED